MNPIEYSFESFNLSQNKIIAMAIAVAMAMSMSM
jgi:hypothetical protein